jgi:hypothetical protein
MKRLDADSEDLVEKLAFYFKAPIFNVQNPLSRLTVQILSMIFFQSRCDRHISGPALQKVRTIARQSGIGNDAIVAEICSLDNIHTTV